jgi:hypothetical protein
MAEPTLTDYVHIIMTLFDMFVHNQQGNNPTKRGRPFTFAEKAMIVLFTIFQFRRIYHFKAQERWLKAHPEMMVMLGWEQVPCRTTFSRRYKRLYQTLQAFVAFIGQYAAELDPAFSQAHLVEDKSLFKALGPVWHQSDRKEGRIPNKLRNLDTEATWFKSGYQGWVYGYGLHITCNEAAFPTLVRVETAAYPEERVLDEKADYILHTIQPKTLAADDKYTKATRIRQWATQGVALLTPALRWVKGCHAQAYHRFIKEPDNAKHLSGRRTSVEPFFDLIAKVLGVIGKHKQLPVQRQANVQTCLALATFSVQIAMVVNSIWGLPLRNISTMATAFT